MKRTATEAFPVAAASLQPNAAALCDPKAYFKLWQEQAAAPGGFPQAPLQIAPPVTATGRPVDTTAAIPAATAAPVAVLAAAPAAGGHDRSEIMQQIEEASAVRCAAIVKEKGANFTTAVALEALNTMATKSSFKLREELVRQPPVRKLCLRVQEILRAPPVGLSLETLAKATWNLTRFPEDVRGDAKATLGPAARVLAGLKSTEWDANSATKMLWSLAKVDIIGDYKPLVSKIVDEIVRDKGRRVADLSDEALANLLWSVARARRHFHAGDQPTVHAEANDEVLFDLAAKRITETVDKIDVRLLADLIHTHAEIGIKNEKLFKVLCPRLVAKQKELREDVMGKVIRAYARFMIPLKEEPQGYRTMAVVQKGDFIRPSEKPKKQGKRQYDHPVSLYPRTQLHSRG
mmetsp:Transcript_5992/g.14272  ORF Transcript_5992/g.14272 Transcript_5992/m.14272 type:complete len:405 (+) Transcript_5992:17-1231(+)|eukprot:CAMPEP_0171106102 /NCGR_PEP_ID=MMETSP0766_2-20121228/64055_1 /TAXON_ID=439317 /ORGANISM="Gambierdiscus australes, Strain CAWD 149" /LENGTH=404 /DNA_ID=CAMNT_0011567109 /DNA_START=17 /DNA_END=1231 /DNA_ORIENTATION=+